MSESSEMPIPVLVAPETTQPSPERSTLQKLKEFAPHALRSLGIFAFGALALGRFLTLPIPGPDTAIATTIAAGAAGGLAGWESASLTKK